MLSAFQDEKIAQADQGEELHAATLFEETLDQYLYQKPKRGQILEGEIEAINDDAIILDVGLKRAAIVPGREVGNLDDDAYENLSVGDVIPIQVTRTPVGDDDLIVSIDDAQAYQSWQTAKEYLENNETLELKVIGKNKGGLVLSFESLEGFVPNSHVPSLRKVFNPDAINQRKQQLIGSQIKVKVIEVAPKRKRLILSAREAHKGNREQRLQELNVWDIVTGTVANIVNFGLFIDLGGVDGLVHISELDWNNIDHPSDVAQIGDEIEVQIIKIDRERQRIQLSRKALLPNPWDEIESQYVPGDLVEVEITNVVDFGAFATLPEGVQGLIHETELGYSAPGSNDDIIEPGSKVLVQILRINTEQEKISLSMRKVPMEKQIDWMLQEYSTEES